MVASLTAFALCALGAGFVAAPDDVHRLLRLRASWDRRAAYGWSLLLFVAGVVLTAVAIIAGSIDALDNRPPFFGD